jgi:predicted CoA-binding protein
MLSAPVAELIRTILSQRVFAVVGASRDPAKYGHLVYVRLKRAGYTVYPVNPSAETIDGDRCYPTLDALPERPDCVVCVTPPEVTKSALQAAGRLRVPYAWLQPGAEAPVAVRAAEAGGVRVVHGGPCIMVVVGQRVTRVGR